MSGAGEVQIMTQLFTESTKKMRGNLICRIPEKNSLKKQEVKPWLTLTLHYY